MSNRNAGIGMIVFVFVMFAAIAGITHGNGLVAQTKTESSQNQIETITAKITALDLEVRTLKNTSAGFTTGPSGALDCASIPGQCDLTSIVPLKASENEMTGINTFWQFQLHIYPVGTSPIACNANSEGWLLGQTGAMPIYCNGVAWMPL